MTTDANTQGGTEAKQYGLGRKFQGFDPRELKYRWTGHMPGAGPSPDFTKPVSLRQFEPAEIFSQAYNDCVANAVVRALMTAAAADESIPTPPMLARSAVYRWAREIDGDPLADDGTYDTSALNGILNHGGIPVDLTFPYPQLPTLPVPSAAVANAPQQAWLASHAPFYHSDPGGMVAGIVSALQDPTPKPVVIGFQFYQQFYTPTGPSAVISLPISSQLAGGHEVMVDGFEPAQPGVEMMFVCANSWGNQWGQGGYFRIPASLMESAVIMDARAIIPTAVAPSPHPAPTPAASCQSEALAVVDDYVARLYAAAAGASGLTLAEWNWAEALIGQLRDQVAATIDN